MARIETMLTGATRHRPGWFGRMVLEVEEQHRSFSTTPPPPGRDGVRWDAYLQSTASRPWYTWRDATYADVAALERRFSTNPIPQPDTEKRR